MEKQTKELQLVLKDLVVGYASTAGFSTSIANTDGTVGIETGYIKGIITDIHVGSIDVKVVAKHNVTTDVWSAIDYEEGSSTNLSKVMMLAFTTSKQSDSTTNQPNSYQIFNNSGVSQRIERTRFLVQLVLVLPRLHSVRIFDALKVAPGDQIKSLNGTYSGDVCLFKPR